MNIEVELPDGSIAEFPPGTSEEVMRAQIERFNLHRQNRANAQARQPESASPEFVAGKQREAGPTAQELAYEARQNRTAGIQPPAQQRQLDQGPMVGPSPANPSRNPDPTERGPNLSVPNRLIQGQRGGGNADMPPPRSMSAFPEQQAPDQAPVVQGAGQPKEGPRSLLEQMTPEQRKAFNALPPEQQQEILRTGAPSADSARETTTDQLQRIEGDDRYAPIIAPFEGPFMTIGQAEERLTAWERGRPEDYTGPRPTRRRPEEPSQAAPEASPAPAEAPEAVNRGQTPLTAMQALNASAGLQLPQSLSTREARSDRADLNAGAPNSFPARKMPARAADTAVSTGMDRLHQMKDQYIAMALQNGDWRGAAEFSAFMNQDRTQRGMTQMNRAFAAATYGDNDAFVPALAEMVNQFDPDGPWQVNTQETKLIEQDGQAVGATLALTNRDTGEVMTQDYMGMQSVLAGISQWGSPMGHFEANQQRVEAAVTQRLERASNFQSTYDEVMEAMFPADSWVDYEKNYIGQEEQQRRHQAVVDRIQQVRPDLVPQGAASGVGAGGFTGGSNGQPVPTLGG